MLVLSVLLMASRALVAAAAGDPAADSGQLGVPPALIVGFTFAAIVVTQVVLYIRAPKHPLPASPKAEAVACVMQKDDALERQAEARAQVYPVGSLVSTKANGAATVLAYDAATKSYKVELSADQDGGKEVVSLRDKDVEVAEVTDFFVYPIKSCAGIRMESVEITPKGVLHDRNWMFADENGKFITQRRYNKMALIVPKLLPNMENPKSILLTAEGMDPLEVPILREGSGEESNVRVWASSMIAIDQGDKASEWINTFLADARGDRKFRFFRIKDSFKRATNPKYAPDFETGFADGYPFLLALESSLDELNKSLDHSVPMNRFRPNIVLKGSPPFAEESWNCLVINGIRFRNVKPCARCNLPCVDQATGISDPNHEPAKTLTRLRNGQLLGFTNGKKYENYFGTNLVAECTGNIKVGAQVKVLTLKNEVFA